MSPTQSFHALTGDRSWNFDKPSNGYMPCSRDHELLCGKRGGGVVSAMVSQATCRTSNFEQDIVEPVLSTAILVLLNKNAYTRETLMWPLQLLQLTTVAKSIVLWLKMLEIKKTFAFNFLLCRCRRKREKNTEFGTVWSTLEFSIFPVCILARCAQVLTFT